jgi:glycosyl transferase family 25
LIPIYVICLKRTLARRAQARARFDALRIPFEFLEAVDGLELSDADALALCPKRFSLRKRWPLSKAEIACAESHAHALRAFLDSKSEFGCVMEDDAELQADLADFLDEALLSSLPAFDAMKLGSDLANRRDVMVLPIATCGGRRICVPLQPTFSAIAYIVSRSGAGRLLRQAQRLQDTADVNFFRCPAMDARILEVRPSIVTPVGWTSTILTDPSYHPAVPHWRSIMGWIPHKLNQWERQVRRFSAFARWQGVGAFVRLEKIPTAGHQRARAEELPGRELPGED